MDGAVSNKLPGGQKCWLLGYQWMQLLAICQDHAVSPETEELGFMGSFLCPQHGPFGGTVANKRGP